MKVQGPCWRNWKRVPLKVPKYKTLLLLSSLLWKLFICYLISHSLGQYKLPQVPGDPVTWQWGPPASRIPSCQAPRGHENQSPFLPVPKSQLTGDWCSQRNCNFHAGKCLVPGLEVAERFTPARSSAVTMGTAATKPCPETQPRSSIPAHAQALTGNGE